MSYKIAVLGPIPRDEITTRDGVAFHKYGCVLYTTAVLSALMGDTGTIVPVSHLRRADAVAVHELLGGLAGVDASHVTDDGDSGAVIRLAYTEHNRRSERQTGFMNPITADEITDICDSDAFVLVPVTDYEISLDVLRTIRTRCDGLVIFDAHGPTNTVTRHGERHLKYWLDRDQWLPYIDVLKMNLEEAACTWFAPEYTGADLELRRHGHDLPLEEVLQLAEHCLDRGVSAVIVTLDVDGCVAYFRDHTGDTREEFIGRIEVTRVIDTTGCGDSFAGGLAFGLLHTGNYIDSCKYGNAAGAQRCAATEQLSFYDLAATEQQIREAYATSGDRR